MSIDAQAHAAALAAPGFMPDVEGLALHAAALYAATGVWVEVGTYSARSTCYLGAAAARRGATLLSVDHHRGSEENQPGEQYHDPALVDRDGRIDTLPSARATLTAAGLDEVVLVVGHSARVAAAWRSPLTLLFLDGGHSDPVQHGDYDAWTPHLAPGGILCIHDVFPDPADGGRPPYEVYLRALGDGFAEEGCTGSLRVLRRSVI